jgi:hypothetical protein
MFQNRGWSVMPEKPTQLASTSDVVTIALRSTD